MNQPFTIRLNSQRDERVRDARTMDVVLPSPTKEPNLKSATLFPEETNGRRTEHDDDASPFAVLFSPY